MEHVYIVLRHCYGDYCHDISGIEGVFFTVEKAEVLRADLEDKNDLIADNDDNDYNERYKAKCTYFSIENERVD